MVAVRFGSIRRENGEDGWNELATGGGAVDINPMEWAQGVLRREADKSRLVEQKRSLR